jgi:hypothetical protein
VPGGPGWRSRRDRWWSLEVAEGCSKSSERSLEGAGRSWRGATLAVTVGGRERVAGGRGEVHQEQ